MVRQEKEKEKEMKILTEFSGMSIEDKIKENR